MPIHDTLKKAVSLFVEVDPSPTSAAPSSGSTTPEPAPRPTKTVEQIAREQPGPNIDEVKVPAAAPTEAIETPDGRVNFAAIYGFANLPASPFTAEQVLEILSSLPAELPIEAKRATMKVTLNAMASTLGVNAETVVADAGRKLAALDSYAKTFTAQAEEYVQKSVTEIERMEAEITRKKQLIEAANARQARMVEACEKESDRLDDVLEFFSLDTGVSKHAPQS